VRTATDASVAERLRAALSTSGISVSELARRYAGEGASPKQIQNARRYINKLLAGNVSAPSAPIARKLAAHLDVPEDEFIVARARRGERLDQLEREVLHLGDRLEELADALDSLRAIVEEQARRAGSLPDAQRPP
jgi:transcriptional regulator with XRE-family HTH domain